MQGWNETEVKLNGWSSTDGHQWNTRTLRLTLWYLGKSMLSTRNLWSRCGPMYATRTYAFMVRICWWRNVAISSSRGKREREKGVDVMRNNLTYTPKSFSGTVVESSQGFK